MEYLIHNKNIRQNLPSTKIPIKLEFQYLLTYKLSPTNWCDFHTEKSINPEKKTP